MATVYDVWVYTEDITKGGNYAKYYDIFNVQGKR